MLTFVVGPAIRPHTSIHPGLVHWMLMVVGMSWQFVVSVAVLRHELGGLRWPAVKERIWLHRPRDPATGDQRWALWWWAVPAIAANVVGGVLAIRLDAAWSHLSGLSEPSYARMNGAFGRWDWVANTVLFGLYHVHKIWFWPSMVASSFGTAWAARRYRSFWMGVIVHGVEGFFIVLVVAVLLGVYP